MTGELDRASGGDAPEQPAAGAGELGVTDLVAAVEAPSIVPGNAGDAALLGLIDRLGSLLDRSDLSELEVEVGGTALVLRKPAALAGALATGPLADAGGVTAMGPVPASTPAAVTPSADAPATSRPAIAAPLTGIWYASPAPGSAPFVEVGREVAAGQVVGLIEAMKLFNEIKSDLAGRVVRVVPDSGSLVKAKQPLIEVEPL
jgi:acetyl-CoA carboxylase biotin carboxyl carrier protein